MIRARPLWIGIAAVIAAALIWLWWINTYERVWYDRPLPLEGEATYNDFYVVQQALRAQGVRVESMPQLQSVGHWNVRDSLLLGSDVRTLGPAQIDELLDWVARGGRLLVAAGGWHGGPGEDVLGRIGVFPSTRHPCFQLDAKDGHHAIECFGTFDFAPAARTQFPVAIGSQAKGWILARRDWGLGQIEVVGSLDALRMNYDDAYDPQDKTDFERTADWNWQVIAPLLQGGVFHIVYQTDLPPLYVYLVRYGWYALLPLLIALVGWLWARSQRFGPAMALPAPDRRALGEHIQASGEYLYRRGLVDALYAPLRRRFDEQLRRRDPELAALPTAQIASVIAQRQQLPPEIVQHALQTPQRKQRKAFLTCVQTLLQLIRRL